MPSCEPGHVPPDWTVAAIAAAAPGEERCLQTDAVLPSSDDRGWYLCGGLPVGAGGVWPVPDACPTAPGGVEVALGSQPSMDYRRLDQRRAVVLDCPGRYIARLDGGRVSVVLTDAGPDACRPQVGEPPGLAAPSWRPAMDEESLLPVGERVAPELLSLLPETLRSAWTDDAYGDRDNVIGVLAWEGGPVAFHVGALELVVGQASAWNAAFVNATTSPGFENPGHWDAWDVPVRFRPRLRVARTRGGRPLVLSTWARLRLDAAGGGLTDAIPVRLPEARVCGVAVPAGTQSWLSDAAAPPAARPRCGARPRAAPHGVTFGAGWAVVEWDDVGASAPLEMVGEHMDWNDPGCELRCRAR
ncbi:MAG: hypothetical protein Q8P18_09545 [Pseudomonadota bacterium]|nr:hypothetical protein [Pseudomonadota bacterium]